MTRNSSTFHGTDKGCLRGTFARRKDGTFLPRSDANRVEMLALRIAERWGIAPNDRVQGRPLDGYGLAELKHMDGFESRDDWLADLGERADHARERARAKSEHPTPRRRGPTAAELADIEAERMSIAESRQNPKKPRKWTKADVVTWRSQFKPELVRELQRIGRNGATSERLSLRFLARLGEPEPLPPVYLTGVEAYNQQVQNSLWEEALAEAGHWKGTPRPLPRNKQSAFLNPHRRTLPDGSMEVAYCRGKGGRFLPNPGQDGAVVNLPLDKRGHGSLNNQMDRALAAEKKRAADTYAAGKDERKARAQAVASLKARIMALPISVFAGIATKHGIPKTEARMHLCAMASDPKLYPTVLKFVEERQVKRNPAPPSVVGLGRLVEVVALRADGTRWTFKPKGCWLTWCQERKALLVAERAPVLDQATPSGDAALRHLDFHGKEPRGGVVVEIPPRPAGTKLVGVVESLTYSAAGVDSPKKRGHLWRHAFGDTGTEHGPAPATDPEYPRRLMPALYASDDGKHIWIVRRPGNLFTVEDWIIA